MTRYTLSRVRRTRAFLAVAAVLACGPALGEGDADATEEAALPETTIEGVVIEAEPLRLERTIEALMQQFREALRRDRFDLPFAERPLPGGALELTTRFGRFCVVPVPTQFGSDLARGIDLAQRCAEF